MKTKNNNREKSMGDKEGNDLLISVIMPTYNRGYIIENAIQSVIGQTYSNWELIIVDDASADNTEEVIKRIGESRGELFQKPRVFGGKR